MSQYLTTQEKGKDVCRGAKGDRRRGESEKEGEGKEKEGR